MKKVNRPKPSNTTKGAGDFSSIRFRPELIWRGCWPQFYQRIIAKRSQGDSTCGAKLTSFRRHQRCLCCARWQQAYAETGQFGKAIESAQAAIQLAQSQGDDSLATELEQEIALYELGLPYREMAK